jgi:hypothetical protein
MAVTNKPTFESVWSDYEKGLDYKIALGLFDTVKENENFAMGNCWEGVQSNGLPTPQVPILKRIVLFTVASIVSNSVKLNAVPFMGGAKVPEVDKLFRMVNREFERLFEINHITSLIREYARNAAVDGDCATYTYWDKTIDTGNIHKGAIVTEIIENTRIYFGNANSRDVQKQPYILISAREMLDECRDRAKENGVEDWEGITSDTDDRNIDSKKRTDDKVTVITKLWRNKETGTIWAYECTKNCTVTPAKDLGLTLYPITWLCWDYIQDSYHGQALITGLIPDQIFINKTLAFTQLSLMTTAYPKVIYNGNYLSKWDNGVGKALKVTGPVNDAATYLKGAPLDPNISQFIQMFQNMVQSALGATSVALGDMRPDNTSAIIALQKAAATPHEITRQNLYQSLEDLGRIYIDFMAEYYGIRDIQEEMPEEAVAVAEGMGLPTQLPVVSFDFGMLKDKYYSIKLDVGAAALWSETAAMQTLDNLLMQQMITAADYIERVPEGWIKDRQGLLDKLKGLQPANMQTVPNGSAGMNSGQVTAPSSPPPIPITRGDSTLQRSVRNAAGN